MRIATGLTKQLAGQQEGAIDDDAAEELADLCNGDLAAIRTEIAKLVTYAGPDHRIQRADVEALVVAEKKYSVWELADVLATGQLSRALKFLDKLLRDGEQPPALVGAMAWMFRKLLEAQELGRGARRAGGRTIGHAPGHRGDGPAAGAENPARPARERFAGAL